METVVNQLRKIEQDVFQLLLRLRKPQNKIGNRLRTVCHGDLWMGNLLFKSTNSNCEELRSARLVNFHSVCFLSPATDLAHLLLTSLAREDRINHYNKVLEEYYDVFNKTLIKFGMVLKHLGTTFKDFQEEFSMSVAGEFLCVCLVIPIVALCGPKEWSSPIMARRASSGDRQNALRHKVQMMAITEERDSSNHEEGGCQFDSQWQPLHKDQHLRETIRSLLLSAQDLHILENITSKEATVNWNKHLLKPK